MMKNEFLKVVLFFIFSVLSVLMLHLYIKLLVLVCHTFLAQLHIEHLISSEFGALLVIESNTVITSYK